MGRPLRGEYTFLAAAICAALPLVGMGPFLGLFLWDCVEEVDETFGQAGMGKDDVVDRGVRQVR